MIQSPNEGAKFSQVMGVVPFENFTKKTPLVRRFKRVPFSRPASLPLRVIVGNHLMKVQISDSEYSFTLITITQLLSPVQYSEHFF
jgi:hypothetical protein